MSSRQWTCPEAVWFGPNSASLMSWAGCCPAQVGLGVRRRITTAALYRYLFAAGSGDGCTRISATCGRLRWANGVAPGLSTSLDNLTSPSHACSKPTEGGSNRRAILPHVRRRRQRTRMFELAPRQRNGWEGLPQRQDPARTRQRSACKPRTESASWLQRPALCVKM